MQFHLFKVTHVKAEAEWIRLDMKLQNNTVYQRGFDLHATQNDVQLILKDKR